MIKVNRKIKIYNIEEFKENINNTKTYILNFNSNFKYNLKILKKFKKIKDNYKILLINTNNIDIINCLQALYIENTNLRNEFIYNEICNLLDVKWNKFNPCKFCNNKCIASRNGCMDKEYDGCCYSFERKRFGKVKKEKCIHLKSDKTCDTKNISCKLFTCDYLKKNKLFSTSFDDYLLLKLFFNKKERLIIKYNFFKTKEEILKKLQEKSIKPYILYLLSFDFVII